MNKKNKYIEIVSDKKTKKIRKDNIIIKRVLLMFVILTASLFSIYLGFKIYNSHENLTPKEHKLYIKAKKEYEKAGIKNFSAKDYKETSKKKPVIKVDKDGKVIKEKNKKEDKKPVKIKKSEYNNFNVIEESQKIANSNDSIESKNANSIKLINKINPGANISEWSIARCIMSDKEKYNNIIENYIGWPTSKYDPEYYDEAQKYIKTITDMPKTGIKPDYNVYTFPYENQQAQVRYAIYHDIQLDLFEGSDGYDKILKTYLETRPNFKSIDTMFISYENVQYDDEVSNISVIIMSQGVSYTAHLAIDLSQEYKLRLLDIGEN